MKYFHFEREDWWGQRNHQIDPFSVIGIINRNISAANVPRWQNCCPIILIYNIRPQHSLMVFLLWTTENLYLKGRTKLGFIYFAMESAKTKVFSDEFKRAFEQAISVNGNGLTNITMGLFWIRPTVFMPLDGNSRDFISSNYGITVPGRNCTGDEYVKILESLKKNLGINPSVIHFPNYLIERGMKKQSKHGQKRYYLQPGVLMWK